MNTLYGLPFERAVQVGGRAFLKISHAASNIAPALLRGQLDYNEIENTLAKIKDGITIIESLLEASKNAAESKL